jgi:hypothetical protein
MSSDDNGSSRKNKHHVLPKSRIRDLHANRKLKRGCTVSISIEEHEAFHCIFHNGFAWDAAKLLKEWAKQFKNPPGKKKEPVIFYEGWKANKLNAFLLLFGFEPVRLGDNGNLKKALAVVKDRNRFFPPPHILEEYQRAINQA